LNKIINNGPKQPWEETTVEIGELQKAHVFKVLGIFSNGAGRADEEKKKSRTNPSQASNDIGHGWDLAVPSLVQSIEIDRWTA